MIPLMKLILAMSHTPETADRRVWTILGLGDQEVHLANRGDAPPPLSRSRRSVGVSFAEAGLRELRVGSV
jgi:hypothetical protein